jgi:hypothetical protein
MKKVFFILPIFVLLFLIHCDNPQIAVPRGSNLKQVSVTVLTKPQASSTYRITISVPDMTTIGPNDYAGGQTIDLYVPGGNNRKFHFERYDSSSVLTDTGTTISHIGPGMNSVTVTLVIVTPVLATYTVTYDGNVNTDGTVPSGF